jgi:ABC-2 type transport system ATP-binding protein
MLAVADAAAIEARGLTRRFGAVTAVNGLELRIPRAGIYGFLGPNGSGKTTTIRMLCGLLEPSAGTVTTLGLAIPDDAERLRARMGYLTQRFSLWEDLSVQENLHFIARIFGLSRAATAAAIASAMQRYDLGELAGQRAGTLSGGQRQRLALAAVTLHRPELLLLDEPTSAVDPQSRRDFWENLFELAGAGTTILVSTHHMDEAERCHRLAILDDGRLVAEGPPAELTRAIGNRVLEIRGASLGNLRRCITGVAGVHSVAQLGLRLRVLTAGEDVAGRVRTAIAAAGLDGEVAPVTASLEDVFVAATSGDRLPVAQA